MATGESKTKWDSGGIGHSTSPSSSVTLSYEGKTAEASILRTPPQTYTCIYKEEPSSNRLYYDDNLNVLATLLQDEQIVGKVRLVYIDPPYATGGIFKSRSQQDAYTDLMAGAHYLEFLRRRLILLRELLAEDGSIYVHLDGNMAFQAKILMDELFGEKNFRNWITRQKCNPKNYTRKTYGNISDFILFYTKSNNYVWQRPYEPWTAVTSAKEYQYVEPETGRRYKKVPIHAPGTRNGATGRPWRGQLPPSGKHWQYTPDKLDEMEAKGEIYWSPNGNPRRKIYLDQSEGKAAQDIWLEFKDAHNQNIEITGYPTEKNPDLLRRIIHASSKPGDIVLDCFAGSGTTLEVAGELGRRWIGVDDSPQAIEAIVKRLTVGRTAMGDFMNGNGHKEQAPLSLFEYAAQWSQGGASTAEMPTRPHPQPVPLPCEVFTIAENMAQIQRFLGNR